MKRRVLGLVLSVLLVLNLIPMERGVYAGKLESIQNVNISQDGILSWDEFEGASIYRITLNGNIEYPIQNSPLDLWEIFLNGNYDSGDYSVSIYAENENGEVISQTWSGVYSYTAPARLATPTNFVVNEYKLTWDADENSDSYISWIYIDGYYSGILPGSGSLGNTVDFSGSVLEGQHEYTIEVSVTDTTNTYRMSEKASKTFTIDKAVEHCSVTYNLNGAYIDYSQRETYTDKNVLINTDYSIQGESEDLGLGYEHYKLYGTGFGRDGYYLEGFTLEGDTSGKIYKPNEKIKLNKDATFVAKWKDDNRNWYSVTFDPNGGYYKNGPSTNNKIVEFSYSEQSIIRLCGEQGSRFVFKKDGEQFIGWRIKGGGNTIYSPAEYVNGVANGGEYTVTGNVDFIAVWSGENHEHTWDKGKITKAPTCTKEGQKTFTCTTCNKTKVEKVSATGHKVVKDRAVAATTTSTGLSEGSHCSVCGMVIKKQTIIPKKTNNKSEDKQSDSKEEDTNTQNVNKLENTSEGTKYIKSDGTEAKSEWVNVDGIDYYFNSDGYAASNEWRDGKWISSDGSCTYSGKLEWKGNSTGWWVEDTVGWYPKDSWQKIDGVWYYFKPDGYLASDEYYNGYWFNKDGSWDPTYKLSWKSNSTGWWVEDVSGWWPSNSWLKIDGDWYYFDGSGYMVTNQYVSGWWIGADGVCR